MKAKNLLLSFLSIICFGFSVFAIISCSESKESETISNSVDHSPTDSISEKKTHVHNYVETEFTDATCTEAGHATYTCDGCEDVKYETWEPKGHTETIDAAIEPTCTKFGLTEGKRCSVCNEVLIKQEIVAATGHTEVVNKEVLPTCTETGLTEGKHCSTCNEILVEQEEVAAKGHNYHDYVCSECGYNYYTEGLKFFFDTSDGEYSVSVYNIYNGGHVVIPALYNGKPVTKIIWGGEYYKVDVFGGGTASGDKIRKYPAFNSITIPDSVTSIDEEAFWGCDSLTSITIPDSVTSIDEEAFYGCSSLTSVTIKSIDIKIDENAFLGCTQLKYNTFDNGNYWGNEDNPYLILMSVDTSTTTIDINKDTKVIFDRAFLECSYLENITIPEGVIRINKNAFVNCKNLRNISIPNSVEHIGSGAFLGCDSLKYRNYNYCLYLGNENNPYLVLVNGIILPVRRYTINENTKFILEHAFEGHSSLISITIPDSVTRIGYAAFSRCDSLTTVYYTGTEEQWNNITGLENAFSSNVTIEYNHVAE